MPRIRKVVTIKANVPWAAKRSGTSKRWIGVCDALNLAIEADSLDELHALIPETIHLLMRDLLQDDELDQFLREKGWQASDGLPSARDDDVEFDVPWHLIAEGARGSERRAH